MAVQVLELTNKPDTSLRTLAHVVEQDQALAAKILKTVNSSFYGLAKPCGTVDRALNYLGMNTVKSLVLGFSLFDSSKLVGHGTSFDLQRYWKRSIYSAVGARVLSFQLRRCDPDEAFTASLFQDIGILASVTALGEEYVDVVSRANMGDDSCCEAEQSAFEFDHTMVGAALARKWRLPESYAAVAAHHHRPRGVPTTSLHLVRTAVAARYAVNMLLEREQASQWSTRLERTTREWFGCEVAELDRALEDIASASREVERLFDLEAIGSISSLLAEAEERAIQVQLESERASTSDPLTGLGNRRRMDEQLASLFEEARASGSSLTVIICDADHFKSINDTLGHQAGDAVLKEIGERLATAVSGRGEVFRYGGEEFVALMPGLTPAEARAAGEGMRKAMASFEVDISALGLSKSSIAVTLSAGIAHAEGSAWPAASEHLVQRADEALYEAKHKGRNRVEWWAGADVMPAPQPAGRTRLLIVEDDPLAAAIWRTLLGKQNVETSFEAGVPGVKRLLTRGYRPDVVVVDHVLCVGTGPEAIKEIRAVVGQEVPILLVSAHMTEEKRAAGQKAGATACMGKIDLCSSLGQFIQRLVTGKVDKLWAA
ncbi:MAG: HDOD domain-containing protein [Phycisphaerales bacterium]|nr:HDOD domain-containing protein [Phycisphaerales bacterium]